MKQSTPELTIKIVFYVFKFMQNNSGYDKEKAIELLKDLANIYQFNLKKVQKIDLNKAFLEFLGNEKGYPITINNLISAL